MGIELREFMNWARRRKTFASLLVGATLAIGIFIGAIVPGGALARRAEGPSGAAMLAVPEPVALSNAFSGITKKVEPAVVNISTTQVLQKPKSLGKPHNFGSDDDLLNRFFSSPDDSPDAERSIGSGVIVDKKGFILTNQHVIDGATRIQVSLDGDSRRFTARVIGSDKETDLAVIKIDTEQDLPVVPLGNSDGVQVGDWVLAFGSPFGFSSTVTAGIVSAKNRAAEAEGQGQFQRFIQTDAAINPGNSGGPLVNMAGEVIGINTAIYTGSHGFEGVGLSMPSNVAIGIYNQLVTTGKVTRGAIGITFDDRVSQNPVTMKELGAPYGIVVEATDPDSPAQKAGLQPEDVITSVNGQAVHNGYELVSPIAATPIGETVQLHIIRNKQPKDVALTVEDRSKIVPTAFEPSDSDTQDQSSDNGQFGLHVQDLTSDLSQKLGMGKISAGVSPGVVVTNVDPASFADDLQFLIGDVIEQINSVPVGNLPAYHREMSKLQPGQDVLFKVKRYDGRRDHMLIVPLAGTIPVRSAQ
ncbi:MAG TPA: trypsin-like peptidase domain-containing protein [Candidatus Acidoferrales bacterium]|nr:trypsin-like peptidase domain-containing protein [Candidatus Acidoferrales bacterium]